MLDLLQALCSKPGQVKMANLPGLQMTYTACDVASRLQYWPTLPVPLLVTTCLPWPLRLLLLPFLLGKARDLQHSLASAISPALLHSWQSPRHSSPRMLKQAQMIQEFFLLALPTSLFCPIPTYPLLSVQRSYLTTCGNKSHFEHSSITISAFL